MTKRDFVLLTWLVAGLSSPVLAQKVGPEFQVNQSTTGYERDADVASDSMGNFMVVWHNAGYYGHGVFGRNYDSDGNPLSDQFQIGEDGYPAIASTNGNFIVVWGDREHSVLGQRYDIDGNPLGDQLPISTAQVIPRVASDASGNFVVVYGSGGRRFDSYGNPLGDEFQVNGSESVASDANGNFVVVWSFYYTHVFGQRYDNTGTPVGEQFQVETYTTGYQENPSVATTPDGNFLVVWQSGALFDPGPDGDAYGVSGQLYDHQGTRVGGEFQVNQYTPCLQRRPDIAADKNGNFVVIWDSAFRFCAGDVYSRRYDAQGRPLTDEFQFNTEHDTPGFASVASSSSGSFVVVWETYTYPRSQSGYGIFGQRFSTGCRSTLSNPSSLCPENPN